MHLFAFLPFLALLAIPLARCKETDVPELFNPSADSQLCEYIKPIQQSFHDNVKKVHSYTSNTYFKDNLRLLSKEWSDKDMDFVGRPCNSISVADIPKVVDLEVEANVYATGMGLTGMLSSLTYYLSTDDIGPVRKKTKELALSVNTIYPVMKVINASSVLMFLIDKELDHPFRCSTLFYKWNVLVLRIAACMSALKLCERYEKSYLSNAKSDEAYYGLLGSIKVFWSEHEIYLKESKSFIDFLSEMKGSILQKRNLRADVDKFEQNVLQFTGILEGQYGHLLPEECLKLGKTISSNHKALNESNYKDVLLKDHHDSESLQDLKTFMEILDRFIQTEQLCDQFKSDFAEEAKKAFTKLVSDTTKRIMTNRSGLSEANFTVFLEYPNQTRMNLSLLQTAFESIVQRLRDSPFGTLFDMTSIIPQEKYKVDEFSGELQRKFAAMGCSNSSLVSILVNEQTIQEALQQLGEFPITMENFIGLMDKIGHQEQMLTSCLQKVSKFYNSSMRDESVEEFFESIANETESVFHNMLNNRTGELIALMEGNLAAADNALLSVYNHSIYAESEKRMEDGCEVGTYVQKVLKLIDMMKKNISEAYENPVIPKRGSLVWRFFVKNRSVEGFDGYLKGRFEAYRRLTQLQQQVYTLMHEAFNATAGATLILDGRKRVMYINSRLAQWPTKELDEIDRKASSIIQTLRPHLYALANVTDITPSRACGMGRLITLGASIMAQLDPIEKIQQDLQGARQTFKEKHQLFVTLPRPENPTNAQRLEELEIMIRDHETFIRDLSQKLSNATAAFDKDKSDPEATRMRIVNVIHDFGVCYSRDALKTLNLIEEANEYNSNEALKFLNDTNTLFSSADVFNAAGHTFEWVEVLRENRAQILSNAKQCKEQIHVSRTVAGEFPHEPKGIESHDLATKYAHVLKDLSGRMTQTEQCHQRSIELLNSTSMMHSVFSSEFAQIMRKSYIEEKVSLVMSMFQEAENLSKSLNSSIAEILTNSDHCCGTTQRGNIADENHLRVSTSACLIADSIKRAVFKQKAIHDSLLRGSDSQLEEIVEAFLNRSTTLQFSMATPELAVTKQQFVEMFHQLPIDQMSNDEKVTFLMHIFGVIPPLESLHRELHNFREVVFGASNCTGRLSEVVMLTRRCDEAERELSKLNATYATLLAEYHGFGQENKNFSTTLQLISDVETLITEIRKSLMVAENITLAHADPSHDYNIAESTVLSAYLASISNSKDLLEDAESALDSVKDILSDLSSVNFMRGMKGSILQKRNLRADVDKFEQNVLQFTGILEGQYGHLLPEECLKLGKTISSNHKALNESNYKDVLLKDHHDSESLQDLKTFMEILDRFIQTEQLCDQFKSDFAEEAKKAFTKLVSDTTKRIMTNRSGLSEANFTVFLEYPNQTRMNLSLLQTAFESIVQRLRDSPFGTLFDMTSIIPQEKYKVDEFSGELQRKFAAMGCSNSSLVSILANEQTIQEALQQLGEFPITMENFIGLMDKIGHQEQMLTSCLQKVSKFYNSSMRDESVEEFFESIANETESVFHNMLNNRTGELIALMEGNLAAADNALLSVYNHSIYAESEKRMEDGCEVGTYVQKVLKLIDMMKKNISEAYENPVIPKRGSLVWRFFVKNRSVEGFDGYLKGRFEAYRRLTQLQQQVYTLMHEAFNATAGATLILDGRKRVMYINSRLAQWPTKELDEIDRKASSIIQTLRPHLYALANVTDITPSRACGMGRLITLGASIMAQLDPIEKIQQDLQGARQTFKEKHQLFVTLPRPENPTNAQRLEELEIMIRDHETFIRDLSQKLSNATAAFDKDKSDPEATRMRIVNVIHDFGVCYSRDALKTLNLIEEANEYNSNEALKFLNDTNTLFSSADVFNAAGHTFEWVEVLRENRAQILSNAKQCKEQIHVSRTVAGEFPHEPKGIESHDLATKYAHVLKDLSGRMTQTEQCHQRSIELLNSTSMMHSVFSSEFAQIMRKSYIEEKVSLVMSMFQEAENLSKSLNSSIAEILTNSDHCCGTTQRGNIADENHLRVSTSACLIADSIKRAVFKQKAIHDSLLRGSDSQLEEIVEAFLNRSTTLQFSMATPELAVTKQQFVEMFHQLPIDQMSNDEKVTFLMHIFGVIPPLESLHRELHNFREVVFGASNCTGRLSEVVMLTRRCDEAERELSKLNATYATLLAEYHGFGQENKNFSTTLQLISDVETLITEIRKSLMVAENITLAHADPSHDYNIAESTVLSAYLASISNSKDLLEDAESALDSVKDILSDLSSVNTLLRNVPPIDYCAIRDAFSNSSDICPAWNGTTDIPSNNNDSYSPPIIGQPSSSNSPQSIHIPPTSGDIITDSPTSFVGGNATLLSIMFNAIRGFGDSLKMFTTQRPMVAIVGSSVLVAVIGTGFAYYRHHRRPHLGPRFPKIMDLFRRYSFILRPLTALAISLTMTAIMGGVWIYGRNTGIDGDDEWRGEDEEHIEEASSHVKAIELVHHDQILPNSASSEPLLIMDENENINASSATSNRNGGGLLAGILSAAVPLLLLAMA